jgi:hypothetical protein
MGLVNLQTGYLFGCLIPYLIFILYYYFHRISISDFFTISCHNMHVKCTLKYYYIYSSILYCILNTTIGIWVQSRKEDQILRLNLNLYRVIIKITHVSTVVVGSRYFRFRIFLERVLGTILRDDRDASLHVHVSRVVD